MRPNKRLHKPGTRAVDPHNDVSLMIQPLSVPTHITSTAETWLRNSLGDSLLGSGKINV